MLAGLPDNARGNNSVSAVQSPFHSPASKMAIEAGEPAQDSSIKDGGKLDFEIDWNKVDLDSLELPEGEDFGIKR